MTTLLITGLVIYSFMGSAMICYLMYKAFQLEGFESKKDFFWWWSVALFIGIFWLPFSIYVFVIKDFAEWWVNLPDE